MAAAEKLEQLIEEIAEATRTSVIGVGAKATVAVKLAEAHAWLNADAKPPGPRAARTGAEPKEKEAVAGMTLS